jgi:hypothetical protein
VSNKAGENKCRFQEKDPLVSQEKRITRRKRRYRKRDLFFSFSVGKADFADFSSLCLLLDSATQEVVSFERPNVFLLLFLYISS